VSLKGICKRVGARIKRTTQHSRDEIVRIFKGHLQKGGGVDGGSKEL